MEDLERGSRGPFVEGEVRVAGPDETHQFKRGRVTATVLGFVRCECLDTGSVVFAVNTRVTVTRRGERCGSVTAASCDDERDEEPIGFVPTALGWIAS